jgi:HEPN domain-containing protein
LKAALAARGLEYPYTHELRELVELALPCFPALAEVAGDIAEYTEFAVRLRYDGLPWVTSEEAAGALAKVERLSRLLAPHLPEPPR